MSITPTVVGRTSAPLMGRHNQVDAGPTAAGDAATRTGDLDPWTIPTSFTLDLAADAPAALLAGLQGFADHTTDPTRSDAALLAMEAVRIRMMHPATIHQILQLVLDPVGIHPATITITPDRTGGLALGFDTSDICRRACHHLRHLGYTIDSPDPADGTTRRAVVRCA